MPHLGEELLLLAIDQNHGRLPASGSILHSGLAAAVLAELELRGHIRIEDGRLTPCADHPNDPVLAEALGHLRRSQEVRGVEDWIGHLPSRMDLAHALAMQLARRGRLRVEQRTILGLFSTESYSSSVPDAAASIPRRLHGSLERGAGTDARSRTLAGIAHGCGLLESCLSSEEWAVCRCAAEAACASSPIASALNRCREKAEAETAVFLMIASGD